MPTEYGVADLGGAVVGVCGLGADTICVEVFADGVKQAIVPAPQVADGIWRPCAA